MTDAPEPDILVDARLAGQLVAAQHPDLAGPIELVANGWDNAMFRLGEHHLVRLPRRTIAAGLVLHEQRWLPEIASRVTVPVPAPVRIGRPDPELGFGFPWSILPWFDGVSAADVAPSARAAAATSLAGFVAELAVSAPADAPTNPYRGVPLAERDEVVQGRFERGLASEPEKIEALRAVWNRGLAAAEWSGPPTWLHGDLHPANLVLAASGDLAAVIDFGDVCAGDPAGDLATAWLTFDAPARAVFRAEIDRLRATDAAMWDRARGWALVLGSAIIDAIGASGRLGRVGVHALDAVLAD
ncbi:aminoglycoside phosphotransferase family protein [Agromyces cerinus]|uniref:Predicted kinase, aminoglycoside phosphotransferase (APT) family n=1 Tax=Agromyces cerinus subsp. cerinus TaxID=232089 RepID=A0A1N6G1S7_9MICO|nr:aminoglycoside phosphotransferase family protein [Agromyces cerinus]SIO01392.1 Predicted kinase, aminoglycoside phosphotransferase (APT) family [Agromyces cerinus subsp. cerinus]